MFAKALKKVYSYTKPVLTVRILHSQQAQVQCATFVIVNADGWVLTAAHILKDIGTPAQQAQAIQSYDNQVAQINSKGLSNTQRKKQLAGLLCDPNWLDEIEYLWYGDQAQIEAYFLDEPADLALVKLKNLDTSNVTEFPIFKNPSDAFDVGTALCRVGCPFPIIDAKVDRVRKTFEITGDTQIPMFPIEGIHTREKVHRLVDKDTGALIRDVSFIETSSPGLLGQSGGPIVDTEGVVWGLQSHTSNLDLGFSPKHQQNGKQVVEHQFLNVGFGAHVREIIGLLQSQQVSFNLASKKI